jgi:hypothetical protein
MSYIRPMGDVAGGPWAALRELTTKVATAVSHPADTQQAAPAAASPAPAPSPTQTPTSPTAQAPATSWGPVLLIAGGTAVAAYLLFFRGRQ